MTILTRHVAQLGRAASGRRTRWAATGLVVGALAAAELASAPTPSGTPADAATAAGEDAAAAAPAAPPLPAQIGAAPRVRQMITVTASGWDSTTGALRAWRRDAGGDWRLAKGPVRVVVGYNGWAKAERRKQGTGTTPAGRFGLPYTFGRLPDPGARLPYRRVDGNDWWPYEPRDPATYNVYQFHKARRTTWRESKAEHLDSYTKQYGYAMVVGYNLPQGIHYSKRRQQWVADQRARIHRGGGIFLHVRGKGATAGCVAMRRAKMRWLVRWVRPGASAQVVMGPRDYLTRL